MGWFRIEMSFQQVVFSGRRGGQRKNTDIRRPPSMNKLANREEESDQRFYKAASLISSFFGRFLSRGTVLPVEDFWISETGLGRYFESEV